MILFPNCKINIGLQVISKREDGYHNLETVFFPLPVFDVLEMLDADTTSISLYGVPIPGNSEDNIVLKAYKILKNDFPDLPPVHFHLLKNIPAGAGLGAGSANGAFALTGINKKFNLGLSQAQLINYALQLGSDCPFFILNKPCLATGRGENMRPIPLDISNYKIIIINPGIHVATPWAFKQLQPATPQKSLEQIVLHPVNEWKHTITNDFETAVFAAHSQVEAIKKSLYNAGAVFALMSGSGSTVYGIFEKDANPVLNLPTSYFIKTVYLNPDTEQ
ncbi:MAG: 4-(cytidine 5'-diphospho)-2-C-methyl-D-erythritol kinase [Niabella sp.]